MEDLGCSYYQMSLFDLDQFDDRRCINCIHCQYKERVNEIDLYYCYIARSYITNSCQDWICSKFGKTYSSYERRK